MKQVESLFSNFTCNPKMLPEFMCYFPRLQKLQTDGQYIVAARSSFSISIMTIAYSLFHSDQHTTKCNSRLHSAKTENIQYVYERIRS